MLKFSTNLSLLFNEVPLLERFKVARQQGFQAVEVQFPYTLSAESLRACLDEQQLTLVLFNVDADDLLDGGEGLASVPEKQEQFRHAVAQAVAYAKVLKPEFINVLPGRCFNEYRRQAYLKTFKDNLLFAVEAFAPLGIKTVFEAINDQDMPGFMINHGVQMLDILDELRLPSLFMQYDIYHLTKMGDDIVGFISQNADRIGHIQFADCPGRGQPGTGDIDFENLFSVIKQSSYSGWVGAEYKPIGSSLDSLNWFNSVF
ncbi:MAG: hydroxypyruvate isomerase [Methylococcales bacterium]|nr:MAG: hydroxypyruvate isomerase [Methylococcales bacterium]